MGLAFAYKGHEGMGGYIGRQLVAAGFAPAGDVREADVVFTYFTSESALEDAYLESDGLVRLARGGTLLVDLSPTTPSFARELAAIAAVNELRFAEAPVVVADPSRESAFGCDNMACYVASDEDGVFEDAAELLEAFVGAVVDAGGSGQAQLAKAACSAQIAAGVLSAVEAGALFGTAGATHDIAVPACSPIAAGMNDAIALGSFESDYTVEMMMADVAAALTVAEDADLVLPQLESAMHLLEILAVIGGADKGVCALSLLYCDEEASAQAGLDWTRAEGLFQEAGHDHAQVPGHAQGDYDGYDGYDDYDAYGDYGDGRDPFGPMGGFGGYSSN